MQQPKIIVGLFWLSWAQGLLPALDGPQTAPRAWGLRMLPPETQESKGPFPPQTETPGTAQGTGSQHTHTCVLRGGLHEPGNTPVLCSFLRLQTPQMMLPLTPEYRRVSRGRDMTVNNCDSSEEKVKEKKK